MFRALFLSLFVFFAVFGPALSQGQEEDAETPVESRPEPTAPYDEKLMRLAEVLGALHYLRNLCEAGDGMKWRDTMSQLIAAENPGPQRKSRLTARFNRGYRAFDETYGTCTSSAVEAANRYVQEGVQLTTQITRRYGR